MSKENGYIFNEMVLFWLSIAMIKTLAKSNWGGGWLVYPGSQDTESQGGKQRAGTQAQA